MDKEWDSLSVCLDVKDKDPEKVNVYSKVSNSEHNSATKGNTHAKEKAEKR